MKIIIVCQFVSVPSGDSIVIVCDDGMAHKYGSIIT